MTPTQARAWATYVTRRAPWRVTCLLIGHNWRCAATIRAVHYCPRCARDRVLTR